VRAASEQQLPITSAIMTTHSASPDTILVMHATRQQRLLRSASRGDRSSATYAPVESQLGLLGSSSVIHNSTAVKRYFLGSLEAD
jgi:hypothetical protein